jgi:hypothetical protein
VPEAHQVDSELCLNFVIELALVCLCELIMANLRGLGVAVLEDKLTVDKGSSLQELLLDEWEDLLASVNNEYVLLQSNVDQHSFDHQDGLHCHVGDLIKEHTASSSLFDIGTQNNHLFRQVLRKS